MKNKKCVNLDYDKFSFYWHPFVIYILLDDMQVLRTDKESAKTLDLFSLLCKPSDLPTGVSVYCLCVVPRSTYFDLGSRVSGQETMDSI